MDSVWRAGPIGPIRSAWPPFGRPAREVGFRPRMDRPRQAGLAPPKRDASVGRFEPGSTGAATPPVNSAPVGRLLSSLTRSERATKAHGSARPEPARTSCLMSPAGGLLANLLDNVAACCGRNASWRVRNPRGRRGRREAVEARPAAQGHAGARDDHEAHEVGGGEVSAIGSAPGLSRPTVYSVLSAGT
jgi:hypothetical protein